jgi:hypothetical protein
MLRIIRAWIAVALFVAAAAGGCSLDNRLREKSQDLTEDLLNQATDFNRMITWRYFDDAVPMVVPQSRQYFMSAVEKINEKVHMEGYKIVIVQVSDRPIPRVRGEAADITPPKKPQIEMPPPEEDENAPKKTELKPQTSTRKTMPKIWYGLVLVRFINLTVTPHRVVRSPLIRQYWYWNDQSETWMVDPEIEQLLEMGQPPEGPQPPAPTGPTPPTEKPIVPTP